MKDNCLLALALGALLWSCSSENTGGVEEAECPVDADGDGYFVPEKEGCGIGTKSFDCDDTTFATRGIVLEDRDGDGIPGRASCGVSYSDPEDCDDDDPTRGYLAPEVWNDMEDSDCLHGDDASWCSDETVIPEAPTESTCEGPDLYFAYAGGCLITCSLLRSQTLRIGNAGSERAAGSVLLRQTAPARDLSGDLVFERSLPVELEPGEFSEPITFFNLETLTLELAGDCNAANDEQAPRRVDVTCR